MLQPPVAPERLLAEVEGLLQSKPARATIRHETEENTDWFGRAGTIVRQWDFLRYPEFATFLGRYHNRMAYEAEEGLRGIMTMLHEVRHDLRMRTTGPVNVAIGQGQVFAYFDNLRKIITMATSDLFFVDPYLDADFVSRYLPLVTAGTGIRLLTSNRTLATLLPAVDAFGQQTGQPVGVRTATGHDRFVFIDRRECYQSGASFKDGAKNALTTLTQITDAFAAVSSTYENMWNGATVHR
jgi:hypothetical protein